MDRDLTELLRRWPYDAEKNVRIITANDSRNVLQVRLPLGIEQYELDGRPDGKRPHGKETFVEEMQDRIAAHVSHYGSDAEFGIGHDEFEELQNEGLLFYYRYLLLFQINDFERVSRDTQHNLTLCRMLERYCPNEEERNSVLQFKPYVVRMNAMSRAMISIRNEVKDVARKVLSGAIEEIEALEEIESPAFRFERIRSVNYLQSALQQIEAESNGPIQALESELQQAVEEEDYERAAELRDRLRNMR